MAVLALVAPVEISAAEAGRLLFVLGPVEVEHAGSRQAAQRGNTVEAGDTLHTGAGAYTQIRMVDGALVSLRPETSFLVEKMVMPASAAPATSAPAAALATAAQGQAVMRLLRGGFRAISGLIGKAKDDEYRVVTPVATIGIRGTDYRAIYCNNDCGPAGNGLHVGVSDGSIVIENNAGTLNISNDQYAYVGNISSAPERQLEPPAVLDQTVMPTGTGENQDATGTSGDQAQAPASSGDSGSDSAAVTDIEYSPPQDPNQPSPLRIPMRSFAFAAGPDGEQQASGAGESVDQDIKTDGNGGLVAFPGYSIGTSSNTNQGEDPATGIRWGRWHGGAATVSDASGTRQLDLSQQSLHWIYSSLSDQPALPLSGSVTYDLIGNTNPTDSAGHVGTLGSAFFTADFTRQTVSNTINIINLNGASWTASAESIPISGNQFAGSYDNVSAGGNSGTGQMSGFFVTPEGSPDGSTPNGAGMSYSMSGNPGTGDTTVSGTAAFGNPH